MSEARCLVRLQEISLENDDLLKENNKYKVSIDLINKELDKVLEGKVENLPAAKRIKEIIVEL